MTWNIRLATACAVLLICAFPGQAQTARRKLHSAPFLQPITAAAQPATLPLIDSSPAFEYVNSFGGTMSTAAVSGTLGLVDEGGNLVVLDLHDPAHPTRRASAPLAAGAIGIRITGTFAFVAGGTGIQVFDIGDPDLPRLVGEYRAERPGERLEIIDQLAYLFLDVMVNHSLHTCVASKQPDPARELVRREPRDGQALMRSVVILPAKLCEQGDQFGVGEPGVWRKPFLQRPHAAFGNPVRLGAMPCNGHVDEACCLSYLLERFGHEMHALIRNRKLHPVRQHPLQRRADLLGRDPATGGKERQFGALAGAVVGDDQDGAPSGWQRQIGERLLQFTLPGLPQRVLVPAVGDAGIMLAPDFAPLRVFSLRRPVRRPLLAPPLLQNRFALGPQGLPGGIFLLPLGAHDPSLRVQIGQFRPHLTTWVFFLVRRWRRWTVAPILVALLRGDRKGVHHLGVGPVHVSKHLSGPRMRLVAGLPVAEHQAA